jgi:hypothetical protein
VENSSLSDSIALTEKYISKDFEDFYFGIHLGIVEPVFYTAALIVISGLNVAIVFKLVQVSESYVSTAISSTRS